MLAPIILLAVVILWIVTTKGKLQTGNNIKTQIETVREDTCDSTVKELTELLKKKRAVDIKTGNNFADTRTPKLLAELIPYIKSHKNVSEDVKKELFTAMRYSEYFRLSRNHNDPEMDRLIQESICLMQQIEQTQRMNDEMVVSHQQMQQEQFEQFQQETLNHMQQQQADNFQQVTNDSLNNML